MYEEPKTLKESIQFIEAALVASTSRVLQKRKILEEEHFQKADYAGVYVSLLNPSSNIARNVLNKIKSVCSVLEDGYLSKYSIVICDDSSNPENAIEAFTWQFHYYGDTVNATFSSDKSTSSVSFPGKKRAKKTMIKLLKEISHTATKLLDPLPDGCFAGMRIAYNDSLSNTNNSPSRLEMTSKDESMEIIEHFRSFVESPFEDQLNENITIMDALLTDKDQCEIQPSYLESSECGTIDLNSQRDFTWDDD